MPDDELNDPDNIAVVPLRDLVAADGALEVLLRTLPGRDREHRR